MIIEAEQTIPGEVQLPVATPTSAILLRGTSYEFRVGNEKNALIIVSKAGIEYRFPLAPEVVAKSCARGGEGLYDFDSIRTALLSSFPDPAMREAVANALTEDAALKPTTRSVSLLSVP